MRGWLLLEIVNSMIEKFFGGDSLEGDEENYSSYIKYVRGFEGVFQVKNT